MTNSVQLPVQLACSYRATSVSATPCLPIGKLHACTRAARLPHGIGSCWLSSHFIAVDNSNVIARCSAWPQHRDQQSLSLLADCTNCIVFAKLFAIAWLINRRWECHEKIAGETSWPRSASFGSWPDHLSKSRPAGGNLGRPAISTTPFPTRQRIGSFSGPPAGLSPAILQLCCAGERDSLVSFPGVVVSGCGCMARALSESGVAPAARWRVLGGR
jgi:hypothetical protein